MLFKKLNVNVNVTLKRVRERDWEVAYGTKVFATKCLYKFIMLNVSHALE